MLLSGTKQKNFPLQKTVQDFHMTLEGCLLVMSNSNMKKIVAVHKIKYVVLPSPFLHQV